MFTVREWLFLGFAASYLAILGTKCLLAWRTISRCSTAFREQSIAPEQAAKVSILQPILSGDPSLADTLEGNLRTLSPHVSFVWLVDEEDHLGQSLCGELGQRYKNATIVRTPTSPSDHSPKAFKLHLGLQHVQTEYCAILDDDTRIGNSSLLAAIDRLNDCDLYTGLPYYRPSENFWGSLLTAWVNNNSILTYLPPLAFAPPLTINGMFYVFRAQSMQDIGGFQSVARELCDDYAVCKFVRSQGWRVEQGIAEQQVGTSIESLAAYWRQMHRWTVFALLLVWDQRLVVQGLLSLLLGLPPLLWIGMLVVGCTSQVNLMLLAVVLVLRQVLLRTMHRLTFGEAVQVPLSPVHSLLAEALQPLHLLVAGISPNIVWRGRVIRIRYRTGQAMEIVGNRGG